MKSKAVSPSLQGPGGGSVSPARTPLPLSFTIRGPLMTFRAPWDKHTPKGKLFRSRILLTAVEAGFRGAADTERSCGPRLTVRVFWKESRPRIEWHEIFSVIKTSVWYGDSSWVQPGERSGFSCGHPEEYAEVEIRYGGSDA